MYICHFKRDNWRNTVIKRDMCGLNEARRPLSMDELSAKYDLRKERIRQILRKFQIWYFPGKESLLTYLKIDDLIGENDSRIQQLIQENELDLKPEELLEVLKSIYGWSETFTLPNGRKYFIKGSFCDFNRFNGIYSDIEKSLSTDRRESISLDFERRVFLGKNMSPERKGNMALLASKMFEESFADNQRFTVDSPLNYTILPNMVNREAAIRGILEKTGVPMTGKEIMAEYQSLYPEDSVTSLSSFKTVIQETDSVVSKGRTGYYILDTWEGHYTGTITELLSEILSNSKVPLSVADLTEKAIVHFPTTGNRSIETLLKREVPNRFVAFEGGKYGSSQRTYPKRYKQLA